MSHADRELPPRVRLRDAADLDRLFMHLLTHWRLPRVEFDIQGLHVLHSQHAQDRFVRLSEACNCLLGESLAAMLLLVGSYATWTFSGGWLAMGAVLAATVGIAFTGKALELAWTRLRLLRLLRDLRRRLASAEGSAERDYAFTSVTPVVDLSVRTPTQEDRVLRPVQAPRPARPRVVLRDATDVDRLFIHLATHWKLPRVEIRADTTPGLALQRAQFSITRLSAGCSYMPAAFLAAAILLGGLLFIVWTGGEAWFHSEQAPWWLQKLDWDDALPVVVAAVCAALIGAAVEWLWMRLQLLLVLRRLRSQLG